jgi:hypothetical protein
MINGEINQLSSLVLGCLIGGDAFKAKPHTELNAHDKLWFSYGFRYKGPGDEHCQQWVQVADSGGDWGLWYNH